MYTNKQLIGRLYNDGSLYDRTAQTHGRGIKLTPDFMGRTETPEYCVRLCEPYKILMIGDLTEAIDFYRRALEGNLTDITLNLLMREKPRFRYSHYDYLNEVLPAFWLKHFEKSMSDMWCGGIIGAHGDKGSCHKTEWEKVGIPYQHGMILFLLSYTKEYPEDRPSWEKSDWVIENYPHFKRTIEEAEKEVNIFALPIS